MIGATTDRELHEECGVFGIYAQDEAINVAEAAYYGLFALQHRGQESAVRGDSSDGVSGPRDSWVV